MEELIERRKDGKRFDNLLAIAGQIRDFGKEEQEHIDLPSTRSIYTMLAENLISEVGGSSGSVMLADRSDMLRIEVGLGIDQSVIDNTAIGPGDNTISRWVYDHGENLYVTDIIKSQLDLPFIDPNSSGSFMSIPLRRVDGIAGVVNVNAAKGKQFHKDDVGYARLIATYMGALVDKVEIAEMSDIKKINMEERIYKMTVNGFLESIRAKNPWVYQHSNEVRNYSFAIARIMRKEDSHLEIAALLHDVGKVGVRSSILEKPAELTYEEYVEMKDHPLIGQLLVSVIDTNGVGVAVREHHQRYDGEIDADPESYPDESVYGDSISHRARIIAAADTLSAMTGDRPYREGCELKRAVEEVVSESGGQFDPDVAAAVKETYESGGFSNISGESYLQ